MKRTSFDHWKDNKYGNPDTHYTETKPESKYERTRNLVRYIDATLSSGHSETSPTRENYRVCEFGCNNGRNLTPLYCLGYDVYGLDISPEAITSATSKMMPFNHPRSQFRVLDLYNDIHMLDDMSDNYFDFSFTMGFLMHLPKGKQKTKLIDQIIRVSKNVVIYEPAGSHEASEDDGWHLSLEDYGHYSRSLKRIGNVPHQHPDNDYFGFWHLSKGD